MKAWKGIICGILAACLLSGVAMAGSWPKIEKELTSWQGPKKIMLRSSLADPLMSPVVQDLLETLLGEGFDVLPAGLEGKAEKGLVLDLRTTGEVEVAALRRADDGSIIAFERRGVTEPTASAKPSKPSKQVIIPKAPVKSPPREVIPETPADWTPMLQSAKRAGDQPRTLSLEGNPQRLALLTGQGTENLELALLYDNKIVRYGLRGEGLVPMASFSPPLKGSRALHLDAADLDGDGRAELSAVWAEDIQGIYEGTDSQPHSWLFSSDLQPKVVNLAGYLRFSVEELAFQQRGTFVPFAGPVHAVEKRNGELQPGRDVLAWGGDLYAATPVNETLALLRSEPGRLQLVERKTGETISGGLLLDDLGSFAGPQIAVRLETPRYRSGFAKEDVVREEFHALPPRLLVSEGAAYTIHRGRSSGTPLLSKASGQDKVVRIRPESGQLVKEEPFAGVDAFVLDFALFEDREGKTAVALLLNDKADGTGNAYLLIQAGQ